MILQAPEQMLVNYFPMETGDFALTGELTPPLKASRRPPSADADVGSRPGEGYKIYHSRDVFGSVPGEYETLVTRGAGLLQIPPEYLEGLVEKFERRKLYRKPSA